MADENNGEDRPLLGGAPTKKPVHYESPGWVVPLQLLISVISFVAVVLGSWAILRHIQPSGERFQLVKIRTPHGVLEGFREFGTVARHMGKAPLNVFRGIRFTRDAVDGDNRFMPAVLADEPWEGVKKATAFRPACTQEMGDIFGIKQTPIDSQSEDCLFLNVFSPNIDVSNSALSLPVLFWVHGGGLRYGSGNRDLHNFAVSINAVVVSTNYRLGPLGFLPVHNKTDGSEYRAGEVHAEKVVGGTGGMNGFNDVIVALQWVQEHIAAFGGNPQKVTIMGESSGSVTVCTLVVSPRAKGLFTAAIMESGACTGQLWSVQSEKTGWEVTETFMRNQQISTIEEMRALPPDAFFWNMVPNETAYDFFSKATAYVDGWVVDKSPRAYLAEKQVNIDRAIVGANSMDSLLIMSMRYADRIQVMPWDDLTFYEDVATLFGQQLVAEAGDPTLDPVYIVEQVMQFYPPSNFSNDPLRALWQADADAGVVCPMLDLATMLSVAGVETYHFSFAYGPGRTDIAVEYGVTQQALEGQSRSWASHAAELSYVFFDQCWGGPCLDSSSGGDSAKYPPAEGAVAATMVHTWGDFVHDETFGPVWPPLDSTSDASGDVPTMVIDYPRIQQTVYGYRRDMCAFWHENLEDDDQPPAERR